MKKAIVILLVLILGVSLLAGCGSADVLKGTWVGTNNDGIDTTVTFDGKGKCSIDNYGSKTPGTYTLKEGGAMDIQLESWDTPIAYHYAINGNHLTLTADNGWSPNYDLTKK